MNDRHIIVIHSADNPYVPMGVDEQPATPFDVKFIRFETAGHFGLSTTKAPEILRELVG